MRNGVTGSSALDERTEGLHYIVDEPAPQDRFGAHSAIVNAIISALETQSHIRLIGLLGRWGTGKSTIVGQLTAALESDHKDKYVLFTYDAWAHQGDPARRSILEELIARLVGLRLTRLNKWHETLLEVSGSTESSSTTTTTRVSTWGKFVIGFLLLLPLILSVIDADTLRRAFFDYSDELSIHLVRVALAYFGLLILIFLVAYASTMDYERLVEQRIPLMSRLRNFLRSGDDLMSILLTRQFPASSSTTLRKSQPTAIEFRRFLRRIIESQRPRRLVFVIDSLDRIDPKEALNIWSIMVGMVADESHRLDSNIEPIVILPFDPIALEEIVPSGRVESDNASDLIEKSFDVTFEVPPPVLSNWRSYFAEQYARCGLLEWTNKSTFEQYWTVRSFEVYLRGERITPRKINRFLNRVISLSRQQAERFGPAILSYYIAHEAQIQKDCLSFLKSSKPGFDETNAWQRKIAAIAFGITQAEAAQVLLGDELIDALNKRDLSAFESIQDVAGFDEVVRNLVEDPPRDDSGAIEAAPLTALATFLAKTQRKSPDPVLWSRLWGAWKGATLPGGDSFVPGALVAFLDAISELAESERSILTTKIIEQVRTARDTEVTKELIKVGDRIVETAEEQFEVGVGKEPSLLMKMVGSARGDSKFVAKLKCQCSFEDLAKYVLDRLDGRIAIFAPGDFRLVADRIQREQVTGERESFFRLVGEGLQEILSNAESPDDVLVAAALILASRDATGLRYRQTISELEDAGTLGQAVDRAMENSADAVVSALTALRLTAGKLPADDESETISTWLATDEHAAMLTASLRQMNEGSFLPALRRLELSGHNVDAILRPILIQAVKKNNIGRSANTSWLIKSFSKVVGWMDATEAAAYAKIISTWTDFSAELQKLSDAEFVLFISKLDTAKAKAALADRLKTYDAAQFGKLITSGNDIWQAYNRYRPNIGENHPPRSELAKGLILLFDGSSGEIGSRVADRGMKLFALLSSAAQREVIRTSASNAIAAGRSSAFLLLTTLEHFKVHVFKPSIAASALSSLFPQLVRTRDGRTYIERNAACISRLPNEDADAIERTLRRMLRSRESRVADWAAYVLGKSGLRS